MFLLFTDILTLIITSLIVCLTMVILMHILLIGLVQFHPLTAKVELLTILLISDIVIQLVSGPTHRSGNTSTSDLAFTCASSLVKVRISSNIGISDHSA